MLGGIDPILIFQIYKQLPAAETTIAKIPLAAATKQKATLAIVPIYLSESITGIYIDTESKNIDVNTDVEGLSSGDPGPVNQKPLGSITTVNMIAKQGSIGLTILLAATEQILDRLASQEYEITYMHGGVTVFGGLIHGFSVDQGREDDLYKIKLEISRGRPPTKSVLVQQDPNAVRLGTVGSTAPANASTTAGAAAGSGSSAIQPGVTTVRP